MRYSYLANQSSATFMLVIPPRRMSPRQTFHPFFSTPLTTPRAYSSSATATSTHPTAPYRTMSRSAADATRFTATSPHAYAKPTPINSASPSTHSASSKPQPNPKARLNPSVRTPPPPIDPKTGAQGSAPPGETPAGKVARLREARFRERAAQITRWDRVVIRGRVWADRAHKITVTAIVGFSSTYTYPSADLFFLPLPPTSTCSQ